MVDLLTELRSPATALSKKSLGDLCREAADEIERLRGALRAVLYDLHDYERVNNLAPAPNRQYCWDSVARAYEILEKWKPR